jgi:membrane protein required for colicin V production
MNVLDIFIVGVVVLSGLFAFARGFVRECLSIAAWLGATAAGLYALPVLRPYAERYLPKGTVADAAAAGVAFLVTLIVLTLIAGMVSRRVKRSSLSALDRTLGLIFGLGRGAMLVGIAFLALSFALPPNAQKPQWIAESRTAPLFLGATQDLARLLPASVRQRVTQFNPQDYGNRQFENALKAYAIPVPKGANGAQLSPEDKERLDQIIQHLASDPQAQETVKGLIIAAPPAQGGR